MAFLRRWLLIFSALVLGGGQLWAASGREERAFAAATATFQDQNWDRAETQFAQFVQRFPKSGKVPAAVLAEAQAQFRQGKYAETIALLTDAQNEAKAGKLADEYAYWIGEAQFAKGDFTNAAETFCTVAKNFPDSPLCLTATVEAAAAYAQFPDWPRHDALLEATNGVFARAAQLDPDNALVINGRLSLAQSQLAQSNFVAAAKSLALLNPKVLAPEQDWERLNLQYQVALGQNDFDAALAVTTNLMQSAKDAGRLADSVAMLATVLEKRNQPTNAIAVWSENLTNSSVPAERQREAVLKIAALAAALNDIAVATASLESYLAHFPNAPGAELALLTLGELRLKDFMAGAAANQLAVAQTNFDEFLGDFTNSPLTGKAYLDRGWCYWQAGDYTDSLPDFCAAAQRLTNSPTDQAVANFKTGDALFMLGDFAGARENYRAVADLAATVPALAKELGDRALYQILRTDLKMTNLVEAEAVMQQLLRDFPASDFADDGQLLLGEAFSDFNLPEKAREVFQEFARLFPGSPLAAQAELAVARTFERETNWPAAIANYTAWLKNHPTNDLRPQVEYLLGRANYQAGREPEALQIFTTFVARFPADTNAPLAQWWVADHYFRSGTNYQDAEKNYELIFQTPAWKSSALFYPAQLMASRAAVGRQDFSDAANYLTKLLADTNCPPPLVTEAMFAYGGVLMQMDAPDTNRPTANFELATNVFAQIIQANPTNESGALAWGGLAKCQLQLSNYAAATNAFAQVFNSPYADVSARSEARIGFGLTLEKVAATLAGTNRSAALRLARDSYLDVFDTWTGWSGTALRAGEWPDSFWVKKAGLLALSLGAQLGVGDPNLFVDRMETLFPQSKASLEKKRAALSAVKN